MNLTRLFLCGIASLSLAVPAARAGVEIIPTHGRNVYRLAVAQGRGAPVDVLIIGSTYDNRVCAFAQDGTQRWDVAVGGFVFDLATGDLDGDGRDEIAVASADGHVYVFDAEGKLRWRYGGAFKGAPVWQVSIARLDGKTPVVIAGGISREIISLSAKGERLATAKTIGAVRIILTGDFDGDGADEVAVLPVRGQAKDIALYEGSKLTSSKQGIPTEVKPWKSDSEEAKQWGKDYRKGKKTWNGSALISANGTVGDIDGDGTDELIYNPGAFSLRAQFQQVVALPERFKVASYDRHYNMRMLATGNLTDAPGEEIVVLEGAEIRLFGSRGELLGRAVAPLGFTDIVYVPGNPHGSVLLASSPNGDDNLYRLHYDSGWEKEIEGLKHNGVMAIIDKNLQQVADTVAKWNGKPLAGQSGPYDIVVNHYFLTENSLQQIDNWIREVQDYKQKFPYPNLRFATCFWPGEDAPLMRPDGKPWGRDNRLAHDLSRAQIVAAAKRLEDAGCPFWVQVGHGCSPHLEVATIAEMLKVAPQALLGFVSAEDEKLDDVVYYFEHHIKPILELCLAHKKWFIPRNKDVWWSHWPADAKMRKIIFNGRYRSVLLPSVEDSNSRSPELNLAPRIGLWLDGQVDGWACSSSADWFSASRSWEWEYPLTGHPQLRYHVSQAMLGARVFMLLNGEREKQTGHWTPVGIDGTGTFLHMLGKGIIAPPKREQLRAISPVALVMKQPSERFTTHGRNGHHLEKWGDDGSDGKPWRHSQNAS